MSKTVPATLEPVGFTWYIRSQHEAEGGHTHDSQLNEHLGRQAETLEYTPRDEALLGKAASEQT